MDPGDSTSYYFGFDATGHVYAAGNVMSLISSDMSKTEVPAGCFAGLLMLLGDNLLSSPLLGATTLNNYCYSGIFAGNNITDIYCSCTEADGLVNMAYDDGNGKWGPFGSVPATVHYDWTMPTPVPENPYPINIAVTATNVVADASNPNKILATDTSVQLHFSGVSSHEYVLPDDVEVAGASYDWDSNTSTLELYDWTPGVAVSVIVNGKVNPFPTDFDYLCFTAAEDNCEIYINKNGTTSTPITTYYSIDKVSWNIANVAEGSDTSPVITLNAGDKVYFAADDNVFSTEQGGYRFAPSSNVTISGNVMSLLNNKKTRTSVHDYCFASLFSQNCLMADVFTLPATTLGKYCYANMLYGNYSPNTQLYLPAKVLAEGCYDHICYYGTLRKVYIGASAADVESTAGTMGYWADEGTVYDYNA